MEGFKTLKDHVYDYIAGQIRDGSLMPGQRINENIICDELNISRTPVREALIQLTAEGVLENRARKGFIIRPMTEKDVVELYNVIGVLDGYAAYLACPSLTKQDFADMSFYIDTIDLAIKAGNFEMYHKQQEIFHQLYINKCGNTTLINTIRQSKNKLLKKTYTDDPDGFTRKVLQDTNQEHREILRLFTEGDADGVSRYLSQTHWQPTYANFDVIV
ncbi:MAG: GntR family transcriptional regulator [Anaerovoracaceae bacterium]